MKRRQKIGKAEVTLDGKAIRTFVGDALWEEASRDYLSEQDAEEAFDHVCNYVFHKLYVVDVKEEAKQSANTVP